MLEYDYKKNLEHLKERYENKIRLLEKDSYLLKEHEHLFNDGLIEGLETAINDIDDILSGLEV